MIRKLFRHIPCKGWTFIDVKSCSQSFFQNSEADRKPEQSPSHPPSQGHTHG